MGASCKSLDDWKKNLNYLSHEVLYCWATQDTLSYMQLCKLIVNSVDVKSLNMYTYDQVLTKGMINNKNADIVEHQLFEPSIF